MNHRIFERTLRLLVFRGARLFEYREILNPAPFVKKGIRAWTLEAFAGPTLLFGIGSS